jgi:hypothetical protein
MSDLPGAQRVVRAFTLEWDKPRAAERITM